MDNCILHLNFRISAKNTLCFQLLLNIYLTPFYREMSPPSYIDLGKNARDVFGKNNFYFLKIFKKKIVQAKVSTLAWLSWRLRTRQNPGCR